MINYKSKIYVAGHKGLVGSAITKNLKLQGYKNILYSDKSSLDLTNQKKVFDFLKKKKARFYFYGRRKGRWYLF